MAKKKKDEEMVTVSGQKQEVPEAEYDGHVGEIDKLVGADCTGDRACRFVGVDVIGVEIIVHSQGRDDGQIIIFQHVKQDLGVNVSDFSHKTDILSIRVFFLDMKEISVLAADPDGPDPQFFHHGDELFGHAAQNHLRDLTGLGVRDAQSFDEFCLLAALLHPLADGFSTAVDNDGLKAYELEQGDVLNDTPLQLFIAHCAPAVLDDNDLAVEFLNIRQRLDQHLGLFLRLHLFPV